MPTFDSEKAAEIHHELHSDLPSDPALRVKTLESLAVERGLVSTETIDAWIEAYSEHIGPKRGAQVVARAWTDSAFRDRLLHNAAEAIAEFGFQGAATGHLKAVENKDDQHHLVVCTLCSCYPFSILGSKVLNEFGVALPDQVHIRVWDSTAELRYLVIPQRPKGTEAWDEEQLAAIVSRNSMIGTERDLRTARH